MAQLEFEIINRYFRDSGLGFERPGVDLGIGDDCALLAPDPGCQLAVSMDLLQEGVHFPKSAIPALVAQRALAVNLSDLAAVGAEPLCFTLGLSLPEADHTWLEAFGRGLLEIATQYRCPLVGGDLIRGNLHMAIQVHGQVPRGQALLRSGAKAGHLVYVTGTLGDAAAALRLFDSYAGGDASGQPRSTFEAGSLGARQRDYFINRFYRPLPRIEVGMALRGLASAAIDLSDGLISDIGHVAVASGTGVEIDGEQLPLSDAMLACVRPEHRLPLAMGGGDDYELCFTIPPERVAELEETLAGLDTRITRIGEIVTGEGVRCRDAYGEPMQISAPGYSHFSGES